MSKTTLDKLFSDVEADIQSSGELAEIVNTLENSPVKDAIIKWNAEMLKRLSSRVNHAKKVFDELQDEAHSGTV